MKKLLVLFLVLTMTSIAGAAQIITLATGASPGSGDYTDVGGEYTLAACDSIWIGVYNDTQGGEGHTEQFACFLEFDSSDTTPPAEWTQSGIIYRPPAVPEGADMGITFYGYTATSAVDWLKGDMANSVPTDFTGVGTCFGVEFHCLIPQIDVEIRLMDDNYNLIDSILIHQVPEPMSIALLGLGGLLLRRRKK